MPPSPPLCGGARHFTALIQGLKAGLAPSKGSVSLAVASWPINPLYARIGYRTGLNYTALGSVADYLVIMGYDLQYIEPCSHSGNCSQPPLWPPLANAPLPGLRATVAQYGQLGVAPSKLVMALPWYGKDFACAPLQGTAATAAGPRASPCTLLVPDTPSGVWPCSGPGCYTHLPTCVPLLNYETIAAARYANASEHQYVHRTYTAPALTNAQSPTPNASHSSSAGQCVYCPLLPPPPHTHTTTTTTTVTAHVPVISRTSWAPWTGAATTRSRSPSSSSTCPPTHPPTATHQPTAAHCLHVPANHPGHTHDSGHPPSTTHTLAVIGTRAIPLLMVLCLHTPRTPLASTSHSPCTPFGYCRG